MYDNLRKELDFDDLLFEKRNKDYGAYQLRKRYNSVLIGSHLNLAILIVSTAALILPFILSPDSDRVLRWWRRFVQVQMENLEILLWKKYLFRRHHLLLHQLAGCRKLLNMFLRLLLTLFFLFEDTANYSR